MLRLATIALLAALLLAPLAAADKEWTPVAANTKFAFDLYGRLKATPGNLFFSPYSISTALAMTREGAKGETAGQMDRVLHLPGGQNARGFHDLQAALKPKKVREGWGKEAKKVSAYEFSIANALWGQKGFPFEKPFVDRLEHSFGAGLERVDFGKTEAARRRINRWVEKKTRDRIQDLIPAGVLTPDARLVLANAIYMKAPWAEPFSEGLTQDASFYREDGSSVDARLMRRTDRYGYAGDDTVQLVELPYRGHDLGMVVLLPRKGKTLADVEAKLDQFDRWVGGMAGTRVAVHVPKFEVTQGLDLTTVLPAMGMTDAFSASKADFTGMTKEEPLYIGFVLHKAFVKVDEEGTEAAAATAVGMLKGAARPEGEPVEFRADRPFFFVIRHRPSGSILFMGRLVDPS